VAWLEGACATFKDLKHVQMFDTNLFGHKVRRK
jgi:hypothetical protein